MIREIPLISDDSDLKEKNNADHGTTLFTVYDLGLHCLYVNNCIKPAFAAMHGPHSLVRIGPGYADRA